MKKHIDGTDRIYISDDGIVSFDGTNVKFDYTQRINNCGYARVLIKINGEFKEKLVHRLVAESFIPLKRRCNLVNHIDGQKLNNCVDNLEWCTHKQNMKHFSKLRRIKNKI
jgi:hypothetical protein